MAKVGVIATAGGSFEAFLTKRQTSLNRLELGTGREIQISSRFIHKKSLVRNGLLRQLMSFCAEGCQVFVTSGAFGVDDLDSERQINDVLHAKGLKATMASEITKLYGLSRRTRTAVINGSILPKMLETADSTETGVKGTGVDVPLMIMRGDGGVMDVKEMKKRPVLTMLSGPAASVMGA